MLYFHIYRHLRSAASALHDTDSGYQFAIVCADHAAQHASADAIQRLDRLDIEILVHHIRQSPQYTLAALEKGVYLIGMKDQFNVHDRQHHPMEQDVQYIADEVGFVLFDRTEGSKRIDAFGPYFIEQYILMEVLSKQEVAENVLDYYVNHKEKLEKGLTDYTEKQGKGFICWRFINDTSQQQRK